VRRSIITSLFGKTMLANLEPSYEDGDCCVIAGINGSLAIPTIELN